MWLISINIINQKNLLFRQKNSTEGGIIIATVSGKKEIEKIIKQDSFYKNQLADFRIIEFNASQKAEDINELIK